MFRIAFLSFVFMACSLKTPPTSISTTIGPSVGFHSYWVDLDSGDQSELGGAFGEALLAAIRAQGFAGVTINVPTVAAADFAATRTEDRATALVGAAAQDLSQSLVVEASASLFSQLQGQFRWVVSVDATLVKSGEGEFITETVTVEIPVFLRYQHQGETEAFVAAAPSLDRALGPLLMGLR
jgi:hypothetical protein